MSQATGGRNCERSATSCLRYTAGHIVLFPGGLGVGRVYVVSLERQVKTIWKAVEAIG